MQTKTFEAAAELVAQVKAGIEASEARTIISTEGAVSYERKKIGFTLEDAEGGITLSSSAAGAGDFLFECGWIAGVLEGKDPNEQIVMPKSESVPVPATILNPAPAPSSPKPNPASFQGSVAEVKAAVAKCQNRELVSEEGAVTTYIHKAQYVIEETEGGFTLTSASAGPGDFYCEMGWIESVLAGEKAPCKKEEAPKEEKPAEAPKAAPAEAPKPAPKAAPVYVAPSEPEKNTNVARIAAIAGAALAGLVLLKKIFKH